MIRTSSDRNRTFIAAIVAASLLASIPTTPRVVHAQPSAGAVASAKALVTDGRALREKGDHKGARDKFKAAYAIVATPIIGVDLGKEHLAVGELVEAREVFVEVTKLPPNAKETDEGKAARAEAATLAANLAPRIPSLRITITGAPPAATPKVSIDGETVPAAALDSPWKVNPGAHVVVVAIASKERRLKVTVKESETKEVTVDFVVEEPAAKPPVTPPSNAGAGEKPKPVAPTSGANTEIATSAPPPTDDRSKAGSGPGTMTWIGFGIGGAGLIVGGVTAVMALSRAGSVKEQCTDFRCPPSTHADYDSARTLGTVSTVSFGVGLVGVGVGLVGLFSPPRAPEKSALSVHATIGLSGIEVRGAF